MKTLALAFVAIVLLPSSLFSQPIEISTADQLQAIGADETSLAGEYVLVNDIDLAGYPWESIFGFSGTFDGNGHVVKGITQNHEGQDYARAAGLFGKTLAGSVVKNVGVVDCNIASQWYTAALVGDLFGEASNCFAINGSVSVAGDCGNTGTLIGLVRESGSVSNCYSNLEFILPESSGWPNIHGGMIGYVAGPVTNCYYAGVITPMGDVSGGGFHGNGVGPFTSCYFNVEVGGIAGFDSAASTTEGGRTTDDMMQEATYVGWDFADIWTIDEGQSYPQLRMFLPPNPQATGPLPEDGGIIEATFVELTWTAGAGATTNNVYISDDEDAVAQGTVEAVETTEASLVVGIPDAPLAPSLTPGMTYYWRVDAVGDETIAGDVWSFSVAPETAYGPSPADGARVMDPNVVLSWKAGLGAIVHYVTVGESFDEVDAAELGLGAEAGETTLDIGQQEPGKIIYWRVDELNGETGEFIQGQVWSFATATSVVDDFEGYKEDPNDPGSISIFEVWLDGVDEALGNGTGAVASNAFEPYAEQDVVHSGAQAMPLNFDNSGQTALGARALYSETSRTFAPAADWSGQTLGLWYRGQSQNTAETLSVVITDAGNNSVVIENTAEQNAVQSIMWTEWAISLGDIEGIDLSQVTTLAIRIGDPAAQQAGSKGKINIDDIAIYPQQLVSPIAITIPVPNGNFEQVYKPGSTTITADLGANWTNGVGPNTPMDGSQTAAYSDETTGTSVDVPGWINTPGWPTSYDWPVGCGSIAREIVTPDGLYYYNCNGGDWGNAQGGTIVSDASLGNVEDGTYTLSMLANGPWGPATPVVLELLADGVALTPTSSVDPNLSGKDEWQEFSRTYDAASLSGHLGESLTIRVGVGSEAIGGQSCFDAVSLSYVPEPVEPTMVPITIDNPGFEDPVLGGDDWTWLDVPGWTWVGGEGPGIWHVTSADFDPVVAPEGQNVLYNETDVVGDAGGVAQVLTETFAANTDYTLTVEIGNSNYYYNGGYSVQLLAGGVVIAEDNDTLWPEYSKWATSTVEYTYSPADAALVGQPLEIRLLNLALDKDNPAGELIGVEFDNVTLSYVPEPAG
ncbi:hypothetical protein ES707_16805 [subsurface metagenome]